MGQGKGKKDKEKKDKEPHEKEEREECRAEKRGMRLYHMKTSVTTS